jgi:3-methyladenine DNA glycosylase AlkD
MVYDSRAVTDEQMERWVEDCDCWDVCDQCCINLSEEVWFTYGKAVNWSLRQIGKHSSYLNQQAI